jgi:hypothetical protein
MTHPPASPVVCLYLAAVLLAGCATAPPATRQFGPDPPGAFYQSLRALCGQAFAGRLVSTDPQDAELAGQPFVMHVRGCDPQQLNVPFHIGENRSRTWVITRSEAGLALKHDHRHEDGSSDETTNYGGTTTTPGTPLRQEFPADADSKALFAQIGRPQSGLNTWAMEIVPGQRFVYEVWRPNRHFRAEFDLTRPVPPPPAPWGHE